MKLMQMSEDEIRQVAEDILTVMHQGSTQQDWSLYSKFMLPEHITPEHQADIEKQWAENEVLRTLTEKRELLGIFKQENRVLISWKQWSNSTKDELMELLWLTEHEGEIKACGNRLF